LREKTEINCTFLTRRSEMGWMLNFLSKVLISNFHGVAKLTLKTPMSTKLLSSAGCNENIKSCRSSMIEACVEGGR